MAKKKKNQYDSTESKWGEKYECLHYNIFVCIYNKRQYHTGRYVPKLGLLRMS